jgi:tetratricopeptide (TPR) repeat protein
MPVPAPLKAPKRPVAAIAALAVALTGAVLAPLSVPAQPLETSRSAIGNYLAGRYAERQRDPGAAARFFEAALAGEPTNFEILQRVHASRLAAGDFSAAAAAAARIAERSPANPSASLTLAVDAVSRLAWDDARRVLAEIPLQGVNRLLVPLLRAWIDTARGADTALDHLTPLAEIADLAAIVDFHRGLMLEKMGRFEEAEAALRRVLGPQGQATPRVAEALVAFLLARGRDAEAREMLDAARANDRESIAFDMLARRLATADRRPAMPDARAGFGAALFDVASAVRGDSDGFFAMPYARLAAALMPEDASAQLMVGDILEHQKRYADANAAFARIPPDTALHWAARLRIAENLNQLDRLDEAIAMLEAMAAERPDRTEALASLGGMLRMKERHREAVAAYDRAIARVASPERRHWLLFYARGIACERSDRWPCAEADFKRALDLMPEQPDVLNYLAYSWVDRGLAEHYDRALAMLQRAVELRPNSGHIIDSLAWALYKLGRYAQAVPLLERAVELLPQEAVILDHLGDAYWRVGRRLEARYQWQRALGAKPEPDLKPQLERKLESGLSDAKSGGG